MEGLFLIDGNRWIKSLEEEIESTSNEKRKVYLRIMINSILCQPHVDIKSVISSQKGGESDEHFE